jgi:hypothetical protein
MVGYTMTDADIKSAVRESAKVRGFGVNELNVRITSVKLAGELHHGAFELHSHVFQRAGKPVLLD